MCGVEEKCIQGVGKETVRDNVEDTGVAERIILKYFK